VFGVLRVNYGCSVMSTLYHPSPVEQALEG
jgi:hypothetical protein